MNFVNQRLKAVAFTKLSCMTLSYVIVAVLFAGMVGKPSISKASSYNVLVEETRNSNDIVSIYNYDTYADFRANNYSDLTETPINLNDLVSFSGLAYDGQYHAITEFVDDNAGSDFVTFTYDTYADLLNGHATQNGGFVPLDLGPNVNIGGFAFEQDPPATVPVPAALPLFLSGLLGLGVMARRRKKRPHRH